MKDNLEQSIQAQIEKLESVQKKLQHQVSLNRELTRVSDAFIEPDFDLEQRFVDNMNAFSKHYPDIYHGFLNYQLTQFEPLLDDVNNINILDTKNNKLLYSENVFKSSFLQYARFTKDAQLLKNTFSEREVNIDRFTHTKYLTKLTKHYLSCADKLADNDDSQLPSTISSMMIFGVGCGYHIEALLAEHRVKNLFIHEPHLDLFYLSLFMTDWSKILTQLDQDNAQLHLSLGEAESESDLVKEISNVFIKIGRFHAAHTYVYVHYADEKLTKVIAEVSKRFYENMLGFGFYDDALISIGHFYHNLKNNVPILRKNQCQVLNETPVFLIGNGPSLDDDIEYIKKLQDKAIIISCGSAIGALHKYGVKPDFHCEMERCYLTKVVLDALKDPDYLKDITLIALSSVPPGVFELFDKSVQALKIGEAGTAMHLQNESAKRDDLAQLNYCNPTVANCALAFCESMGFKSVTLFGIDMGFVGTKHHSEKSIYYSNKSGEDRKLYDHGNNLMEVKGNFHGIAQTDFIYDYSRKVIEEFLKVKGQSLKVTNCSNGAFINGCEPKHARDISLSQSLDKVSILNRIHSELFHPVDASYAEFFEQNLYQEMFSDLCDYFCEMFEETPKSKEEATSILNAQLDRLESFAFSNVSHFYELLRGSLLHTHAVLVNILYSSVDEQTSLNDFAQGGKIVSQYLREIKHEFSTNPFKIDVDEADNDKWIE